MPRNKPKKSPVPNPISKSRPSSVADRWLPIVEFTFFALVIGVTFFLVFQTIYRIQYSPAAVYLDFASKVLNGQMPYRDFTLEYPPLALLFFIIPRLFTSEWPLFSILFQAEVLVFALAGLVLVLKIAQRMGKAPWKLMTPYTLGIIAIGPIIGQQYDIFPAVMTLFALYYFWLGKHKTSWVWLALGVMTKLYPAVLAPIFLIIYWRNHQYRTMLWSLVTFGAVCLLMLSPFIATGPQNLMSLVNYHSQRGIQVESGYAAILLLADKLGWTTVSIDFSFGSWNLSGAIAETFSKLSTYIQGLALLICYGFIWGQVKAGKSQFTRLGSYAVLVIAVLLFTSKVFSPQYIIWLLPLVVLVFTRLRFVIWGIFFVTGILTYLIFPVNYLLLLTGNTGMVIMLFLRDLMLVTMAVGATVSLKRMKSSD